MPQRISIQLPSAKKTAQEHPILFQVIVGLVVELVILWLLLPREEKRKLPFYPLVAKSAAANRLTEHYSDVLKDMQNRIEGI